MAMAQMGNSLATMPWIPRGVQYLAAPIGGAFVALFALEALADIFRTPADKLGAMTQSEG